MANAIRSNLEPIEENDLDLKEKFLGGEKKETEKPASPEETPQKPENILVPEQSIERVEGKMEKDDTYSKILSKVASSSPSKDEDVSSDATSANSEAGAQGKVDFLVNLAQTKGIAHAVKVAKHLENNYILDEFHDKLLSDELHNALIKKGLIKEI